MYLTSIVAIFFNCRRQHYRIKKIYRQNKKKHPQNRVELYFKWSYLFNKKEAYVLLSQLYAGYTGEGYVYFVVVGLQTLC